MPLGAEGTLIAVPRPPSSLGTTVIACLRVQVKSLLALQRRGGGVIELNEKTFQQLLVGKSRPYSVVLVAGVVPGCTGGR